MPHSEVAQVQETVMLLIEYRAHDVPPGRYRAWTEEDSAYGCFKVLELHELQMVIRACTLMGGLCRPALDSGLEPVDMSQYVPGMLDEHTRRREQLAST